MVGRSTRSLGITVRIIAILFVCCVVAAPAQEFKPHPRAKITTQQWELYFDEVKSKHRATERQFPSEHLVVYDDLSSGMSWAFTVPGHPAHPAWVTRQPVTDSVGVNVRQIGYFAGDEPEFAKLFKAYLALNEKMREEVTCGEKVAVMPNNTLERTVKHRGRIVLAMDCVLADAQSRHWSAAQLGR